MKAFVIAQINVTDPDQYRLYSEQVPEITHEPNYDAALTAAKSAR